MAIDVFGTGITEFKPYIFLYQVLFPLHSLAFPLSKKILVQLDSQVFYFHNFIKVFLTGREVLRCPSWSITIYKTKDTCTIYLWQSPYPNNVAHHSAIKMDVARCYKKVGHLGFRLKNYLLPNHPCTCKSLQICVFFKGLAACIHLVIWPAYKFEYDNLLTNDTWTYLFSLSATWQYKFESGFTWSMNVSEKDRFVVRSCTFENNHILAEAYCTIANSQNLHS